MKPRRAGVWSLLLVGLVSVWGCPRSDSGRDGSSHQSRSKRKPASPDLLLQLPSEPAADAGRAADSASDAPDGSLPALQTSAHREPSARPEASASGTIVDAGGPELEADASLVPEWAYHVRQREDIVPPSRPRRHEPAVVPDRVYDSDEPVAIRRLVYRVRLHLPRSYGHGDASGVTHAGELALDISTDRLRARFLGSGWPVDRGSEVRLRQDAHGVYVIDGSGGRPLDPGELGAWFEGRRRGRSKARVVVWREWGDGTDGPGELLCALLAEWAREPRDLLMRRCRHNALPPRFRIGLWLAELTAVVPMELPRHRLRADHVDPPRDIEATTQTRFLHPEEVARIAPLRARSRDETTAQAARAPALTVRNRGSSRLIVIVQGVPLGWIAPQATATYRALKPGYYRVGVIRPLGMPRYSPRTLELPAALSLR